MRVPFLDLRRETHELRASIRRAIDRVVETGPYVLGPEVETFEDAWAAYCGARHAVGVASGTDALTLALLAVGVRPGDEVVTAANTCVPTVAAIEAAGATPVLADVHADDHTLAPGGLEAVLSERTRAVVPVHLYGRCADMTGITRVARAAGLKVVEDAAQAHGAGSGGRRAGSFGDAAAFSFYPTKNLGALGDAGAVVTSDDEIAERVRALRVYGQRTPGTAELSGRNSRLDPIQAAVLGAKLEHLDRWNERRRELAAWYSSELSQSNLVLPRETAAGTSCHHLFVVRVADRTRFRAALSADGIETVVHYPLPIHRHPAYAALPRGSLTVSETLSSEVVSLPLYPQLRTDEAAAVIDAARRRA